MAEKALAVATRIEPLACRQCQRNLHRRNNDARGDEQMSNYEIPYWKKYTLSIEEAAAYFRIGEGKLRKLVSENPNAEYLLWNGNRVQIKRERFERFVDTLSAI